MMEGKSEEQLAKEIAAVASMKNAQANMKLALDRIATLENGLRIAKDRLANFKGYVPSQAYVFDGRKTIHSVIDEAVADAQRLLT